jgi:hypothetical protein
MSEKTYAWCNATMETTRPPKSIHWVTSTSIPSTAGLWAIPKELLKKRSYTHTFSSPGGANVRYAWGLGRKRRVKTSTILWISRKSLPGVAKEASRIFLPGHGKRGELKIFIRQVRRPLMFFFQHHWAPPQLFGIIRGSGFLLVFLFSVGL